mmetsp:Transcript_62543/g.177615  ORF Transcript_62543/g.177615 Transcript_62543/m.177615 type:complete len:217 (+) Transcript_62543:574-1224(+)
MQCTDEAHLNAEVLCLSSGQPLHDAVDKLLEAARQLRPRFALRGGNVLADAVPQMFLDELHINKLGVPAVANVHGPDHGRLVHEVEVDARHEARVVHVQLPLRHVREVLLVAAGHHLVVRPQEELLRVHVEVRGQPVGVEVLVARIVAEVGLAVGPRVLLLLAPVCGRGLATGLRAQPGVGIWILDHHGGEEVGEAVGPRAFGLGLAHELQHQVGP